MSPADSAAYRKRVGAAIRRRRQALGWEQRELAERAGVHINSVQKWEAGVHYPGRKLGKLEAVLGISLDSEPQDPVPPGWRAIINRKPAAERHLWELAALEFLGEIPVPGEDAGEDRSERGRRAG